MAEEPVAAAAVGQSPKEDDADMADAVAPPAQDQEKPDVNLDDLFAGMDSDDEEFPSSKPQPQLATQASNSSSSSDEAVLTPTS